MRRSNTLLLCSGTALLLQAAACSSAGDSAGTGPLATAGSGGVNAAPGGGSTPPASGSGAQGPSAAAGRGAAGSNAAGATASGTAGAAGRTSGASAGTSGSGVPTGAAGAAGNAGAPVSGTSGNAANGGSGMPAAGSGADAGAAGTAGAAGSGGKACAAPPPGSRGMNPLFTDQYTADPGALVDGCTFYIHCGHDEGPNSFVLREWFALQSTDMVTWTKQVALKLSDFAWADANAWAGQVVKKRDKYYWFVPVQERGGGMTIAVAIGDSPTGPFRDAIGKPLINDAFEMSNAGFRTPSDTPFTIDPTVLVDDDDQAYLLYGGFSRMMVAKLSDDLLSIDGRLEEVTPRGFFEAAYLIKREGVYYVIYAAGSNPATIDYSTSDKPLGPWTYGGRILDALPGAPGQDAPTSHPAVAQLAGQWYLVYHISNGPNGGGTYKREVAIEKLTFGADGKIAKLTPSDGLKF